METKNNCPNLKHLFLKKIWNSYYELSDCVRITCSLDRVRLSRFQAEQCDHMMLRLEGCFRARLAAKWRSGLRQRMHKVLKTVRTRGFFSILGLPVCGFSMSCTFDKNRWPVSLSRVWISNQPQNAGLIVRMPSNNQEVTHWHNIASIHLSLFSGVSQLGYIHNVESFN